MSDVLDLALVTEAKNQIEIVGEANKICLAMLHDQTLDRPPFEVYKDAQAAAALYASRDWFKARDAFLSLSVLAVWRYWIDNPPHHGKQLPKDGPTSKQRRGMTTDFAGSSPATVGKLYEESKERGEPLTRGVIRRGGFDVPVEIDYARGISVNIRGDLLFKLERSASDLGVRVHQHALNIIRQYLEEADRFAPEYEVVE